MEIRLFRYRKTWRYYGTEKDVFCTGYLPRYFDVPESARTLWVTLSRGSVRPCEGSLRIFGLDPLQYKAEIEPSVGGRKNRHPQILREAYRVLKEFGTPCWMTIEYE